MGLDEGLVDSDFLLSSEDSFLSLLDEVVLALELLLGFNLNSSDGPLLESFLGKLGDLEVTVLLDGLLFLDLFLSLLNNLGILRLKELLLFSDNLLALVDKVLFTLNLSERNVFESLDLRLLFFGQFLSFGLLGVLRVFLGESVISSLLFSLGSLFQTFNLLSVDELSITLGVLVGNGLGISRLVSLLNEG